MGSRVKIKLIDRSESGDSEKVAFSLPEGVRIPITGTHDAFRRWQGTLHHALGILSYDPQEGLILEGSPEQPMISFRGQIRPRFVVRKCDRLETPAGVIEFLEIPAIAVNERTRWIAREGETRTGATRPQKPSRAMEEADAVWPVNEPVPISAAHEGARVALHFTLSLGLVCIGAETAQLIAMGFEHEISPLPTPFTALFANALAVTFAYAFKRLRPWLQMGGGFLEYYRFFGWMAAACVPWASVFAFPGFVRLSSSLLMAATGASYFHFKFHPKTRAFFLTASGSWATVVAAVLVVLPAAMERLPKATLVERELASAPEYALGADLPMPSSSGLPAAEDAYTQYFQAIRAGDLEAVKRLTEDRLMDAEFSLENGSTPLHVAAKAEKTEIVKYLLTKRANPNVPDPDGNTALTWAVLQKNTEMIEMMLKKRADPHIRRGDGLSISEIAQKIGDPATMDLLTKYSP